MSNPSTSRARSHVAPDARASDVRSAVDTIRRARSPQLPGVEQTTERQRFFSRTLSNGDELRASVLEWNAQPWIDLRRWVPDSALPEGFRADRGIRLHPGDFESILASYAELLETEPDVLTIKEAGDG